ncbi:MAG: tryptophan-rich sensory protein [Geminicoccaceae bacterium]|nr:tryptophan-rich sensory protein [Geminicoccaceae bacterium]
MDAASLPSLVAFLGLNFLAALTGALFRPGSWYAGLAKPSWRPPDSLFGPVWAVLYVSIAVAGWLVWQRTGFGTAILVYLVSLVFNAGWSVIFFGLRRIDWGLAWMIGLWLSILATILVFAPVSTTAALLLLPYLAWVSFAAALNFVIWRLNRSPSFAAG